MDKVTFIDKPSIADLLDTDIESRKVAKELKSDKKFINLAFK